jgi:hypothetical protein
MYRARCPAGSCRVVACLPSAQVEILKIKDVQTELRTAMVSITVGYVQ